MPTLRQGTQHTAEKELISVTSILITQSLVTKLIFTIYMSA